MRGARQRLAKSSELSSALQKRYVNGSACEISGPAKFQAPKANVWSGLTDFEAANATRWLFEKSSFNLTNSTKAGAYDNTLLLVELNIPNKTDVLPYLNGNSSAPERWAHALLDLRTTDEPTYTDVRWCNSRRTGQSADLVS
jgi:primary-amine oxidase